MHKVSNWLWGVVLIALGVILGVNALGIAHIDIFFPGWWTLFIIVPCFIGLFNENDGKTGNLIGIGIGVCLLLGSLDVVNFSVIWKLIVPIVLVIIGLSLLFKDALKSKILKGAKSVKNDTKHEYCSTFAGQKLNFDDEEFDGAKIEAVFGGIQCDLRKAKIKDGALIKASSIFAGITVRVPEDVNVKLISNSIFGGASARKNKNEEAKTTLYIDANCLFGGLEVK